VGKSAGGRGAGCTRSGGERADPAGSEVNDRCRTILPPAGRACGPPTRTRPPAAGAPHLDPGDSGMSGRAPRPIAHRRQPDRARPSEACATGCRPASSHPSLGRNRGEDLVKSRCRYSPPAPLSKIPGQRTLLASRSSVITVSGPPGVRTSTGCGLVQPVRDGVQVLTEQSGVYVEGHRRRRVTEHPCRTSHGTGRRRPAFNS
jgi:hypothetical protein